MLHGSRVKKLKDKSEKDTVATYEEKHKVETHNDPNTANTPIGADSIVHHHIPVLTGQNLI